MLFNHILLIIHCLCILFLWFHLWELYSLFFLVAQCFKSSFVGHSQRLSSFPWFCCGGLIWFMFNFSGCLRILWTRSHLDYLTCLELVWLCEFESTFMGLPRFIQIRKWTQSSSHTLWNRPHNYEQLNLMTVVGLCTCVSRPLSMEFDKKPQTQSRWSRWDSFRL